MSQHYSPRGKYHYIYKSRLKRIFAGLFDVMGVLLIGVVTLGKGLKVNPDQLHNPKKILVVRLDHIGDILFSRPALQALRWYYPNAEISFLTSSAGAQLLKAENSIDHIISWDAPWFCREKPSQKQLGFFSMVKYLQHKHFDLSLDLRGDLRHHILLFLAKVGMRVGYTITGGRFLVHLPCKLAMGIHEVERNFQAVSQLGGRRFPVRYVPLIMTSEEQHLGETFWKKAGPKVVVHPSAGDHEKEWDVKHFAQVIDQLSELGCEVILVGTAQERRTHEKLIQYVKHPIANLAGETNLRALAALITMADCFIGNDSGPAHLAITQGCPTVMIWSESNAPEEWGPWGETIFAKVVRRSTPQREIEETLQAADRFLRKKIAR